MKTQTVLAIGAHIGDAELTAGALLASCAVHGGKAVTLALTAGEKLTVEALLYGMMLRSGGYCRIPPGKNRGGRGLCQRAGGRSLRLGLRRRLAAGQ
mgnify:CR=1 FL=1